MIAIGMQANVHVLDRSIERMRELDSIFDGRASTIYALSLAIEELLPFADLVVGAVLVHGARAPFVVRREHLALMRERAVLVDVAIDQGGCFEHRTRQPIPTQPSRWMASSTTALRTCRGLCRSPDLRIDQRNSSILHRARRRRRRSRAGVERRAASGLNVHDGEIVHPAVAEALAMAPGAGDGQLAGSVGSG